MARYQYHARRHPQRVQHTPPQRQQAAQTRILDGPQRHAVKILPQQRQQLGFGCAGRCGVPPAILQGPWVVPGAAQRGQQTLVDRHDARMLPEPFRIVGSRWHQRIAQCHAMQIEHPGQCRCAAAVHAQHQQRNRCTCTLPRRSCPLHRTVFSPLTAPGWLWPPVQPATAAAHWSPAKDPAVQTVD